MKKITLSFSILALAAVAIVGCKKPVKPEAPVADTELQSSIDVSYAFYSFTDAEMVGAFIADNSLAPKFYMPAANSVGTVNPVQDTTADVISFGFNQTTCLDGRFRDGTIVIDRKIELGPTPPKHNPYANANSRYYRTVGYGERLTLSDYKVDGWKMVTVSADNVETGQAITVTNDIPTDNWIPANTNLSWTIKGNFKMKKGNDSIFCRMEIVKTLMNTNEITVFAANKKNPINWVLANVSYSGRIGGIGMNGKPFLMEISTENPLVRKFTCTPDVVTGVALTTTLGAVSQKTSEYHPFISGVATLSFPADNSIYPRQIYYGGSELEGEGQCDNSGAVLIKGISYPIDFRRQ